jgi:hypothetical protein
MQPSRSSKLEFMKTPRISGAFFIWISGGLQQDGIMKPLDLFI